MRGLLISVAAILVLATPLGAFAQRRPVVQLTAMEGKGIAVSPHVHVMDGWPNTGIVVGDTGILVVDTGLGPANGAVMFREASKRATKGQKLYLVSTHFHSEHAGGQGGFPVGSVTIIRARRQDQEMKEEGQSFANWFGGLNADFARHLTAPIDTRVDVVFDKEYRLDLGGGVTVRIVHLGGGHTMGDTVVLVQPDSVLFAGDLVESIQSPNVICLTCSPRQWIAALDQIAAMRPRIVVPTHGPATVDPSHIAAEKTFLTDVNTRALALKAEGKSAKDAGDVVQAEMRAKYPTWNGLQNLGGTVQRVYANP